jgi:hypothetical protein
MSSEIQRFNSADFYNNMRIAWKCWSRASKALNETNIAASYQKADEKLVEAHKSLFYAVRNMEKRDEAQKMSYSNYDNLEEAAECYLEDASENIRDWRTEYSALKKSLPAHQREYLDSLNADKYFERASELYERISDDLDEQLQEYCS